jgi:hypothetical protein
VCLADIIPMCLADITSHMSGRYQVAAKALPQSERLNVMQGVSLAL